MAQNVFLMQMPKILRDILTENDGRTYCPVRMFGAGLAGGGVPTFLWGAIEQIQTHAFHFVAFAQAFGLMMLGIGALGGGVAVKALTDRLPGSQGSQ